MKPTNSALAALFCCMLCLFEVRQANAQRIGSPAAIAPMYRSHTDTVFVYRDERGAYTLHTFREQQTLYSIARFYGVSIAEIRHFNSIPSSGYLAPATSLRVPFSSKSIQITPPRRGDTLHVPIVYRVAQGETIYRIARRHFGLQEAHLAAINRLQPNSPLQIGQPLVLGWWSIYGVADSLKVNAGETPAALEQSRLRDRYEAAEGAEHLLKGAALWQPDVARAAASTHNKGGFYVLFNDAPAGSVVKVYNHLTRRTLYARVMGSIPDTNLNRMALVVVSPQLARALGALDARFYCYVYYRK